MGATVRAHKTMDDPDINTVEALFADKRCTRSSNSENLLDEEGNWRADVSYKKKKSATMANITFVEKYLSFEKAYEEVTEKNRKKVAKCRAGAKVVAEPVNTTQDTINQSILGMMVVQNKRHDTATKELLEQKKNQNILAGQMVAAAEELANVNKRVNVVEGDVANLKGEVGAVKGKVEDIEYEARKIRGDVQLQGAKQATTDADVENLTEQFDVVTGVLASAVKVQARKTKDPELKAGYKALTGDSLSTNPSSANSPRLSDASPQAFGDVDVSSPGDEFNVEPARKKGWGFWN